MKSFLILLFTLISFIGITQCNQYFLYESFSSALPTQKGTWTNTSVPYGTTPVRTGTNMLTFNGLNDAIRTPLIANPGVLTFWYRRSSNTTAWTLNIQTSPNGTTWTTRGSITTVTTTYQQYSLNIGALGLTNVYIRLIDARGSGTHERYVDDLGITSTVSSENTLIPMIGACSQTLNSTFTYTLTDDVGPAGPMAGGYTNSVNRTITLTPSDNTKKLQLEFTQMDLETSYDYLYIYDGPNTSSTLLATLNGTTIPPNVTAENASGQLTIRWATDISNVGTWGGFAANITSVTVCTTPTNGGTLTSSKSNTTVNDATTLTTSGNEGSTTKIEWSFDNFTTVAGSTSNPANPYSIRMNVQQTQIWFKSTSKNGTCPSGTSNIVSVNLRNAPTYSTGIDDGDYISNVTLNNINNTSTNDGDAYQDFTSQIIELTKGEPYQISVTATNTLSPGQGYAAWIDYNNDGIFQTTENVLQKAPANSTTQLVTVPSDAVTGDVLMRVLSVWNATPSNDAYYSTGYGYGEIEEYTVRISNPIALPVELLYFEGKSYSTFNSLKWATASEQNSSHFNVERSDDGENWKYLTTKQAANNSQSKINYTYLDNYRNENVVYYRLIQYDIDGKFEIFGPIAIQGYFSSKKIIKYINLSGQEVNEDYKGLVFEVYEDGTMRKIIR
jgi:hypothetical protein